MQTELKIGRWVKEEGDFLTPGGTPYFICEKCGESGHLFGVEYPRRKEFCDKCGTRNFYPFEWYKMSLKPCPFCGKTDALIILKNQSGIDDIVFNQYQICCSCETGDNAKDGCGSSSGWKMSLEEVIDAWNRRANDAE